MPLRVLGTEHDLSDRFGERFALVEGHVAADIVRPLARQLADAAQHLALLERRRAAPRFECALRARQREIEIFARRVRQLPDHLVRGRIKDVLLETAIAFDELSVDVEAEIFVHDVLSSE